MQIQDQELEIKNFNVKEFLVSYFRWYRQAVETTLQEIINQSNRSIQKDPPPLCDSVKYVLANANEQRQEVNFKLTYDKMPLNVSYYIPLMNNIRETSPPSILYGNMNPYSVFLNQSQESKSYVDYINNLSKQVLNKNKNYFTCGEIYFVKGLVERLMKQVNQDVFKALTLQGRIAKILKKEPIQLIRETANLIKTNQSLKSYKNYFYESTDHFCNICFLYHCSKHFSQIRPKILNEDYDLWDIQDRLIETPYYDQKYKGKNKPNQHALIDMTSNQMLRKLGQPVYSCIDKSQCYKYSKATNRKLLKYQIQWIDQICGFGITEPCLITKAMYNPNYIIRCSDVFVYIQRFNPLPFSQRSELFIEKMVTEKDKFKKINTDELIQPCFHFGPCTMDECGCINCSKYCCCSVKCSKRVWCTCIDCGLFDRDQKRSSCPCKAKRLECDPDMCGCDIKKIHQRGDIGCQNSQLQASQTPRLVLGKSLICDGLGVFAGENIPPRQHIGEYIGNILDPKSSEIIEYLDQMTQVHYLFITGGDEQVDGKRMGNKTRFVNHALHPVSNCDCQVVTVGTDYRVQMFTKREIKIGEEIFFDYSAQFKTEWKEQFDKRSNAHFNIKKK